jgi:hypothetical protein
MKFSSLFVASVAVVCGLRPAMSQTDAASTLPDVVIGAPKHVAKPRPVVHSTMSHQASPTASTPSATPTSPAERELAKLPNVITGSCADGCQTSFRSGDRPWVGCSWSSGMLSGTCRNEGHYKDYNACTTAALAIGWRSIEVSWYCSSLALK